MSPNKPLKTLQMIIRSKHNDKLLSETMETITLKNMVPKNFHNNHHHGLIFTVYYLIITMRPNKAVNTSMMIIYRKQ